MRKLNQEDEVGHRDSHPVRDSFRFSTDQISINVMDRRIYILMSKDRPRSDKMSISAATTKNEHQDSLAGARGLILDTRFKHQMARR